MSELHLSYLKLLRELGESLDQLSALARQKQEHVREDDLMGLDAVLKQEQAMTLTLRGLEQHRLKLVSQLGLEGTGIDELPEKFPEDLRTEARRTAGDVRESYSLYRSCADAARNMLEVNLHEIERVIAASGGGAAAGAGYQSPGVEPPKNMKTDFRA
ncbi:MAG: flagellar protein FlgN [Butyricicoccus sp.]|nr:flagellar protein FlgN [Butyricicoccus sp.]